MLACRFTVIGYFHILMTFETCTHTQIYIKKQTHRVIFKETTIRAYVSVAHLQMQLHAVIPKAASML